MDALDIFALIVMGILLALAIWLVVLLGSLPGNIARKRNHPQADAITALGWIGVITVGVGWLVAIVWAYYKPATFDQASLEKRLADLERQLEHAPSTGDQP